MSGRHLYRGEINGRAQRAISKFGVQPIDVRRLEDLLAAGIRDEAQHGNPSKLGLDDARPWSERGDLVKTTMQRADVNFWAKTPRATWPTLLRALAEQFHPAICGAVIEKLVEGVAVRDLARPVVAAVEQRAEETRNPADRDELRSLAKTLAGYHAELVELGTRIVDLRNDALRFQTILRLWPEQAAR